MTETSLVTRHAGYSRLYAVPCRPQESNLRAPMPESRHRTDDKSIHALGEPAHDFAASLYGMSGV